VGVNRGVLLDTHVLLWALTDPGRLSPVAAAHLGDATNPLLVSAATAWEIATKHRLGRLPQAQVLTATYEDHLHRLGAETLDVTSRHALLAGSLTWDHRDPFDRMLAAQCLVEGLPLVSADHALAGFAGLTTIW
jgi:PIN domain nuclease of toxin-antitoxin system